MDKFRVKFTRAAQVEVPPALPRRTGYDIIPIPAGTEKEVNVASLRFWQARGCVEVLGRVKPPVVEASEVETKLTKKAIGELVFPLVLLLETFQAVDKVPDDLAIRVALEALDLEVIEDVVNHELTADTTDILKASVADLGSISCLDLLDALREVYDLTLPPSRRKIITS